MVFTLICCKDKGTNPTCPVQLALKVLYYPLAHGSCHPVHKYEMSGWRLWCDRLPGLDMPRRRFRCPVLGCLNIVLPHSIFQLIPESGSCVLQSSKELWVSWYQSRLFLCKVRHLISIELMEGVPSRPFAGKLDVFTPGVTIVIIEPLLNFL